MKITAAQLPAALKQTLSNFYWVSGDEPLQLLESADTLRNAARAAGFVERDVFEVTRSFSWEALITEMQSPSLFAQRKILDVRLPTGKLDSDGAAAINEFHRLGNDDFFLLITSPKMDKAAKNSNWYKALDKHGTHVEVWPLKAGELLAWVNNRFKKYGLAADHDVCQLLVERTEGNLLAADQEIARLSLNTTAKTISHAMLESVSDHSRFDTFAWADSVLEGNKERISKILDVLRAEGEEPTVILWAICNDVRQLLAVSRLAAQSGNVRAACEKLFIFKSRIPLFERALRRNSPAQLEAVLQMGAMIDNQSKSNAKALAWDGLSAMGLRLAGVNTPAALL